MDKYVDLKVIQNGVHTKTIKGISRTAAEKLVRVYTDISLRYEIIGESIPPVKKKERVKSVEIVGDITSLTVAEAKQKIKTQSPTNLKKWLIEERANKKRSSLINILEKSI